MVFLDSFEEISSFQMHLLTVWNTGFVFETEFATLINNLVGGKSAIVHESAVTDDPQRRKPDITKAKTILGWQPKVKEDSCLWKGNFLEGAE